MTLLIVGKLRNRIRCAISIGQRSLAAFHIGLAIVLLWDVKMSFGGVEAFYTNDGFLPLGILDKFRESHLDVVAPCVDLHH